MAVEGPRSALDDFIEKLHLQKPPMATIDDYGVQFGACAGFIDFSIDESSGAEPPTVTILPDLATCGDCQRELFDPTDRRHRYPFLNCTNCGPRFSIIEELPYDRSRTAMKHFRMCQQCAAEYHDPADRRFHAQPNACSACGPQLMLWDARGTVLAKRDDALRQTAARLRTGLIVALKGIGGFQLLVDARNETAVRELRRRKHRPDKPFAVMAPSLGAACEFVQISPVETKLLTAEAAPIVLLRRRDLADRTHVTTAVAPGNPRLGVMLPHSPLHHLLLAEVGFPLVATSGNRADEPICTAEDEALVRLAGIADCYLVHDRPIVRPVDDSVVRELLGRPQMLRRARGYAPRPVRLAIEIPPVLATGAQVKNSVALSLGRDAYLSQHIGDLETSPALAAFVRATEDLPRLYSVTPSRIACDLHPDYASSRFARARYPRVREVQHHHAHILAVMAEHGLSGPVLGVAWDGTGYGPDRTIWGGEFLRVDPRSYERVARLRPWLLVGGDAAVREPRRSAFGLLGELLGTDGLGRSDLPAMQAFAPAERRVLRKALAARIHTAPTSSMGRLFDGVASLLNLRQRTTFEGQAAMDLEFAMEPTLRAAYSFGCTRGGGLLECDWRPVIAAIIEDLQADVPVGQIATRFHLALVDLIALVADHAALPAVALSGGCFQNHWLATAAAERLRTAGHAVYWPQQAPPNDGGIALGQLLAAAQPSPA